jgi:hypothetical protein
MKRLLLVILILHTSPSGAADFGRLFFTPVQRATLDNARKQNIRAEIGSENKDESEPVPQNISIDGLVKRSDGKSTVWVNNRAVNEQQAGGVGIATRKQDNHVRLTVPESGHIIDLKVGQTVEVITGTVAEGYEKGALPAEVPPANQPAQPITGQGGANNAVLPTSPKPNIAP